MQSTAYEVQPGITTNQPTLAGSDIDKHSKHTASEEGRQDHLDSQQPKSAGVERIKLVSQSLTPALRVFLFVGIFLIAYACVSTSSIPRLTWLTVSCSRCSYGLDSSVRATYQVHIVSPFFVSQ